MKVPINEFAKRAKLVKSDDRYEVYDLSMERLVASMTVLHPDKETTGHAHSEAEEIYFFLRGEGKIQLDSEEQEVKKDDLILIPKGCFHKVFNKGSEDLIFLCIFEKYEGRK